MSATLLETPPLADSAEVGRFTARLAAAGRSLQQEGTMPVLHSWRWLGPWLLGALAGDAVFHWSAQVRLGLSLGFLALLLGTIGRAVWVACIRRSPPEHTARAADSRTRRPRGGGLRGGGGVVLAHCAGSRDGASFNKSARTFRPASDGDEPARGDDERTCEKHAFRQEFMVENATEDHGD